MTNDLISRSALKSKIRSQHWKDNVTVELTLSWIDMLIDETPAVDAVEVVRCKDCEHKTRFDGKTVCGRGLAGGCANYNTFIYGDSVMHLVADDDYCSHGERRESEVSE